MSSDIIKRRTVYFEKGTEGEIRFEDFAVVTTHLGTMVEPFIVQRRFQFSPSGENLAAFDPKEETSRIDQIEQVDSDKFPSILSSGITPPVHGGRIYPRTGR